jgi:hypothetical protein
VPIPNPIPVSDEQFELYLKQFRPLEPEPLPGEKLGNSSRGPIVFAAWAAAAAVIFIAAWFSIHHRSEPGPLPAVSANLAGAEQLTNQEPLTVGSASTFLVRAPSFKAALDQMGFQAHSTQFPKGTHSALAAMSKENSKP